MIRQKVLDRMIASIRWYVCYFDLYAMLLVLSAWGVVSRSILLWHTAHEAFVLILYRLTFHQKQRSWNLNELFKKVCIALMTREWWLPYLPPLPRGNDRMMLLSFLISSLLASMLSIPFLILSTLKYEIYVTHHAFIKYNADLLGAQCDNEVRTFGLTLWRNWAISFVFLS
jgi:hypothetical protein